MIKESKTVFSDFLSLLKGVLKAPVDTAKTFVGSGKNATAYFMIGAQALLAAIIGLTIVLQINASMDSFLGSFFDDYKFSVVPAIFLTILLYVGINFLYAALLYAAVKIAKGTATFSHCLRLTAMHAIPNLAVEIVLFLLVLVGLYSLAIPVMLFSFICVFATTFALLPNILGEGANKQLIVSIAVTYVAVLFIAFILNISYPAFLPEYLREGMKELSDGFGNVESLIGMLF